MKSFLVLLMLSSFISFGQDTVTSAESIRDFENLVSDGFEKRLNNKINKGLKDTGFRLLIVTSSTIDNRLTVPRYLQHVFTEWGISRNDLSKSVVLFISKSKSKLKLFIGKDVKEIISKKQKTTILEDIIEPRIAKSDFKGAIKRGIKAILKFF